MSFHWFPLPYVGLADGSTSDHVLLNLTLYAMALGILGACLWLTLIAWQDRAR